MSTAGRRRDDALAERAGRCAHLLSVVRSKNRKQISRSPLAQRLAAGGSIRKPSRAVSEKRRAVCATFALTIRELTAAGFASRYTIADELNRRKVPTQRGGRWHYTSVVRMLTRLGMDKPACGEPGAAAANRWAALVRARTLAPIIRQLQSSGIFALRAIARELNARGTPSARGGKWHPSIVDRLLRRLARKPERFQGHFRQYAKLGFDTDKEPSLVRQPASRRMEGTRVCRTALGIPAADREARKPRWRQSGGRT
jgi:hypothetical protein